MLTGQPAITAEDLPFVADQLDTIAEHDLQGQGDTDDEADAVQKIREARVLLLDAARLLGVEVD